MSLFSNFQGVGRVQPRQGCQYITGPRRDKQPSTLTPRVNLESQINLTCIFGKWEEAGVPRENPRIEHEYANYKERPQVGFEPGALLVWGDGANHHTTAQPYSATLHLFSALHWQLLIEQVLKQVQTFRSFVHTLTFFLPQICVMLVFPYQSKCHSYVFPLTSHKVLWDRQTWGRVGGVEIVIRDNSKHECQVWKRVSCWIVKKKSPFIVFS